MSSIHHSYCGYGSSAGEHSSQLVLRIDEMPDKLYCQAIKKGTLKDILHLWTPHSRDV